MPASKEKQEKKSAARKTGLSIAPLAPPSTQYILGKAAFYAARMQQARISPAPFYYFTIGFMAPRKQPNATFDDSARCELLKMFQRAVCVMNHE